MNIAFTTMRLQCESRRLFRHLGSPPLCNDSIAGRVVGGFWILQPEAFGRPPQGPNGSAAPQESNIASEQASQQAFALSLNVIGCIRQNSLPTMC